MQFFLGWPEFCCIELTLPSQKVSFCFSRMVNMLGSVPIGFQREEVGGPASVALSNDPMTFFSEII